MKKISNNKDVISVSMILKLQEMIKFRKCIRSEYFINFLKYECMNFGEVEGFKYNGLNFGDDTLSIFYSKNGNKNVLSINKIENEYVVCGEDELKDCSFYSDLRTVAIDYYDFLMNNKKYSNIDKKNINVVGHDNYKVFINNEGVTLSMMNNDKAKEAYPYSFNGDFSINKNIVKKSYIGFSAKDGYTKLNKDYDLLLMAAYIKIDDIPNEYKEECQKLINAYLNSTIDNTPNLTEETVNYFYKDFSKESYAYMMKLDNYYRIISEVKDEQPTNESKAMVKSLLKQI